jgi:hypothetical protein
MQRADRLQRVEAGEGQDRDPLCGSYVVLRLFTVVDKDYITRAELFVDGGKTQI